MNFGENILKKFGWKDGDGLGKQNDGIAKPIKVKLKNDQMGLGYNKFDHLSAEGNWWENMYDKASQSIQITNNDQGDLIVTKQKNETTTGSSKKRSKKTIANMTSDELLKLCNGRTAHKGARFGLKLAGKLKRVADQDEALLLCNDDSINPSNEIKNQSKIKSVRNGTSIKENTNEIVNIKKRKRNKKSNETNDDDDKTIVTANNIDEVPRKKLKKNKILVYATDPMEAESHQDDCDTTNTTLESSILEIPSELNLKNKPKKKRK